MNASRLLVALAILAAFIAGVSTGIFVSANPAPAEVVRPSAITAKRFASENLPPAVRQSRGADQIANEITGPALLSRLSTILAVTDENARHREWLSFLPLLSGKDAVQVRELFRKMKAQGRRFDFEQATFWPVWGELDGAAAIKHVIANETSEMQPGMAEMILRGWATTNSQAARAWLAANESVPFYGVAVRGYLDGLARHDLDQATRDARVMGQGRDLSEFMEVLVEQALQQRQLNGMLEWWNKLPDDPSEGSARLNAIGHIISRLAEADPEHAQTWLTERAATPYRDEGSIGSFAERLADKDASAAVAWVTSLPPSSDGHYTGIGRTVRAWAAADKAGLERWVSSLPPSPLRDQAIAAQQEQTLVSLDVIQGKTQLEGAMRVFGITSGVKVQAVPLRAGSIEMRARK